MAEERRRYRPSLLFNCLVSGCAVGLLLGIMRPTSFSWPTIAIMSPGNPWVYFAHVLFMGLVGMVCGLPVWLYDFLRGRRNHEGDHVSP
jgi:hypothetical protein